MRIIITFLVIFTTINFVTSQSSLDNAILYNSNNCPLMEVGIEISTINNNEYKISYSNQGTATAINAYVDISFTNNIEINDATIPFLHHEDKFTFELGDIPAMVCGSFNIEVPASITQMYCANVHIYPDNPCREVIDPPSSDDNNALVSMDAQQLVPEINIVDIGTTSIFEDNVILTNVPTWYMAHSFNEIRVNEHNSISTIQIHEGPQSNNNGSDSNNNGSNNNNKFNKAQYCKTPENSTEPIMMGFPFKNSLIIHESEGNTSNKPISTRNETEMSNVHLEEGTRSYCNIYPNPFTDYTTIELNRMPQQELIINIVDMTGKMVETVQISNTKTIFDGTGLNSGIYFYQCIENGETLFSGKLVVE
ncbi:MAG: T9SS type A sorting domain-containing protein [Saprospiraceae bacterium]|nr:T9SS type A sorting domain-containing protein [Saprospiraceae bacterium]